MTEREAIKELKERYELGKKEYMKDVPEYVEALGMAIKALERQVPYKPKEYEDKFYACKCGNPVMPKWEKYPTKLKNKKTGLDYCLNCGQKLDWRDEDGELE